MVDFLRKLSATSLGETEVLKPRPRSLFEPVDPFSRTLPVPGVKSDEDPAVSIQPFGPRHNEQAPASSPEDRPALESKGSSSRSNPAMETKGRDITTDVDVRQPTPSQPHQAQEKPEKLDEDPNWQPIIEGPTTRSSKTRTPESDDPVKKGVLEKTSLHPEVNVSLVPEQKVIERGVKRTPPAVPEGEQEAATADGKPIAYQQRGTTVRRQIINLINKSENREKPRALSGESTPTVQVTIGRVEVRAIRQKKTSQPRLENKRTPAMNLDEYLRQRSEGGQR